MCKFKKFPVIQIFRAIHFRDLRDLETVNYLENLNLEFQRASKIAKVVFFELLQFPNSFSRKI